MKTVHGGAGMGTFLLRSRICSYSQTSSTNSADLTCFKSQLNFLLNTAPPSSYSHSQHHHSPRNLAQNVFAVSLPLHRVILKSHRFFSLTVSVEWIPSFSFLPYSDFHNLECTLKFIIRRQWFVTGTSTLISVGKKIYKKRANSSSLFRMRSRH